jgi:hypothetical protein
VVRGEATTTRVEEHFDSMEGDVAASTPPSTQIDTTKPSSRCQTDDARPFSGKQAMTFSHKSGGELILDSSLLYLSL